MFKIKNGLIEANQIFGKHRKQVLAFAFGWAIVTASSLYFSYIYGFSIVVIIFVLLPLELGLMTITKKIYDHIEVENRDFYVGFRALMVSISLYSKLMLRGFLWAVLTGFVVSLLGSVLSLVFLAPEVLTLTTYEAMLQAFYNNQTLIDAITITSAAAFIIGGVVYNLKSSRGQMAPMILFDTGFDIQSCYRLSESYIAKDKKTIIRSKLLFYAYYVLAIFVGFLSSYFLVRIPAFQTQYAGFVGFLGFFVSALLIAPIHFLAKIYYNVMYASQYKEAVKKKLQDFLNVKMRVNQQQFVEQEADESKEKQEESNKKNDQDDAEK